MSDSQPHAFRKVAVPEPWPPAEATDRLRAMAADPKNFDISFKLHAGDASKIAASFCRTYFTQSNTGSFTAPQRQLRNQGYTVTQFWDRHCTLAVETSKWF